MMAAVVMMMEATMTMTMTGGDDVDDNDDRGWK